MIKEIRGADIVLTDRIIKNGTLRFENGIITYIGEKCLSSAECVIDGSGYTVMAGFVDIHCHGGDRYDFMDATPDEMLKIFRHHLMHGTTTLIATTMTDTYGTIESSLNRYAELNTKSSADRFLRSLNY